MKIPKPTEADRERFCGLVPRAPHVEIKPMFGNLGSEGWGSSPCERAQLNGPLLAMGVLGRAAAGLSEQLACV